MTRFTLIPRAGAGGRRVSPDAKWMVSSLAFSNSRVTRFVPVSDGVHDYRVVAFVEAE